MTKICPKILKKVCIGHIGQKAKDIPDEGMIKSESIFFIFIYILYFNLFIEGEALRFRQTNNIQ